MKPPQDYRNGPRRRRPRRDRGETAGPSPGPAPAEAVIPAAATGGAVEEAEPTRLGLRDGLLGLLLVALGAVLGWYQGDERGVGEAGALLGGLAGVAAGLAAYRARRWAQRAASASIIGGAACFFLGAWLGHALVGLIEIRSPLLPLLWVGTVASAGLIGGRVGAAVGGSLELGGPRARADRKTAAKKEYKLLDTSVIIDGRIADICETGFMEGVLVIPQFVLHELQYIADSFDSTKRTRGRRGLDILKRIQKQSNVAVEIYSKDMPKAKDVDAKLVVLGKEMGAKVITNDFNLNKVAELQGVTVLNINLLANALKPVVLPGETMNVHVLKEGKEAGQGIAYLDDGTMVVVDNAKRFLGRSVDVNVTSVLQTTAGRMIFTRLKEGSEGRQTN